MKKTVGALAALVFGSALIGGGVAHATPHRFPCATIATVQSRAVRGELREIQRDARVQSKAQTALDLRTLRVQMSRARVSEGIADCLAREGR